MDRTHYKVFPGITTGSEDQGIDRKSIFHSIGLKIGKTPNAILRCRYEIYPWKKKIKSKPFPIFIGYVQIPQALRNHVY